MKKLYIFSIVAFYLNCSSAQWQSANGPYKLPYNLKMKIPAKILIPFSVLLLVLSSFSVDEKKFCDYLISNQLDSCERQLDNYFEINHQQLIKQNPGDRFIELDTLMHFLTSLNCVDTCFYRYGRGYIMKTHPPMADIFIYKVLQQDTLKYLLRIRFDEITKVVWLNKWEY